MLKFHVEHNHFIIGIPARDLTDAEVEMYGGRDFLLATGCYIDSDQIPRNPTVSIPAILNEDDRDEKPNGKSKKK